MQKVNWQNLLPDYTQFETLNAEFAGIETAHPLMLQPRLTDGVKRLLSTPSGAGAMLVTAPDNNNYYQLISDAVTQLHPDMPVVIADNFTPLTLFGAVYPEKESVTTSQTVKGLVHEAQNGVLIVSLSSLLSQFACWPTLKSLLLNQSLPWRNADERRFTSLPNPETMQVKLILVGDRGLISDFESVEPDLFSGLCLYSEFEQDMKITEDNLLPFIGSVKWYQNQITESQLSQEALYSFMRAGARYAEDQNRVWLCPMWTKQLLAEANYEAIGEGFITEQHVEAARTARLFRESYLPERAVEDIFHGQVFIDTEGEQIGQVNGLTVIEMPGHPMAYGEPARISCVIHFGDGDINDVERKAELGGNIHAKGMMIMQAFVSAALNLDQPLPYSASIVFEQSYCEVDGDSASLAELCALVSALSNVPIYQRIAVTGAVDQFGRVQAVGGVNEKIEGFYRICAHRGLTGEQGVILPESNLSNLCLNKDVIEAVKQGKFHIWHVSDVNDAVELLTGLPFGGDEETETVLDKIADRIDQLHQHDECGLFSRLKNWFVQN
ncbi:Lon protease family protein [Parasalinivibrio latis]|uniref:AAA family ATPase n=1 Tax=Parasalinivibrio latis TaxID=2952610 RepID=UPI0030DF723C